MYKAFCLFSSLWLFSISNIYSQSDISVDESPNCIILSDVSAEGNINIYYYPPKEVKDNLDEIDSLMNEGYEARKDKLDSIEDVLIHQQKQIAEERKKTFSKREKLENQLNILKVQQTEVQKIVNELNKKKTLDNSTKEKIKSLLASNELIFKSSSSCLIEDLDVYENENEEGNIEVGFRYEDILDRGYFSIASEFSDGFARIKRSNKYGFIDEKGREVIDLKYDDARAFSEGKAAVKKNGKWFFINEGGVKISSEYRSVRNFYRGVSSVEVRESKFVLLSSNCNVITEEYDSIGQVDKVGKILIRKEGIYQYIDRRGQAASSKYDSIEPYSNEYSRVRIKNRYGVINKYGKEVILTIYSWLSTRQTTGYIFAKREGMNAYYVIFDAKFNHVKAISPRIMVDINISDKEVQNSKGQMEANLAMIATDSHFALFNNTDGSIIAKFANNNKLGLYIGDKEQIPIISYSKAKNIHFKIHKCKPPNLYKIIFFDSEKGERIGTILALLIDNKLNIKAPMLFDRIYPFDSNGLAIVSDIENRRAAMKKGVVDSNGSCIIPYGYQNIERVGDTAFIIFDHFDDFIDAVNNGETTVGVLDNKGDTLVPIIYEAIGEMSEGKVAVKKKDSNYGYFDLDKKELIIPYKYKTASSFSNGLAIVQGEDGLGLINKNDLYLFPLIMDEITNIGNGVYSAKKGRTLFNLKFDSRNGRCLSGKEKCKEYYDFLKEYSQN